MKKRKHFVTIGDTLFSVGVSLLMQIHMYAYRPKCLSEVSDYVFDQWFHKESIPRKKRAKQTNKRKQTSNISEETAEEAQPDAPAVGSQT